MTIEDLAETVGVPTRTIRYYITERLLPGPDGRGKATIYSEKHLLRLRLVRRLAEERVPLTEIRDRLGRLLDEDIRLLLVEQDQLITELQRAAQTLAPRDYVSALIQRAREARRGHTARTPRDDQSRQEFQPSGGPEASSLPEALRGRLPPARECPQASARRLRDLPPGRGQAEGTWYRWEIEPGVELHIRSDLVKRYRYPIDILRQVPDERQV